MNDENDLRTILWCILAVSLSAGFIYINAFVSFIFFILFSVPISTFLIACVAGAYLVEQYMLHLLSDPRYDIEKELDKLK